MKQWKLENELGILMTETEKMQGEVKDKMKPDMDSKNRMMYMSIKK